MKFASIFVDLPGSRPWNLSLANKTDIQADWFIRNY